MGSQNQSTKELLLDAVKQTAGGDMLETIEPVEELPDPALSGSASLPNHIRAPMCITQRPIPPALQAAQRDPSLHDLVVGLNDEIPRWAPGSVIRWAAWRQGFSSQEEADYAALQLAIAAEAWNRADVGVSFEWVAHAKDATFVLTHGGDEASLPGLLARSFFPSHNDLEFLYVYNYAFSEDWKPHMWNVFAHELGHVLGLRHEFALGDESCPNVPSGKKSVASSCGDVHLNSPGDLSVMNYRGDEPPEIQQADIDSTRKFYSMRTDASGSAPKIGMTQIVDYMPS